MLKIYLGNIENGSNLPLLLPHVNVRIKDSLIFIKSAFRHYQEPVFELTAKPAEADFLLIPQNYFGIKHNRAYLREFIDLSRRHNKALLVFAYGDSAERIDLPNALIFRTSQYRSQKTTNEIIMPGYTEDLADGLALQARAKSARPVVGFCGWADLKDFKSEIKYRLKTAIRTGPHKQGIYFRRKALAALAGSGKIETNFIIRKSYSGHTNTISLSPERARQEYIDNIIRSDFVLAVKGDGNFSYRFYETLSLGRLPLFIDTDCVLPLEDLIDYNKFVLATDYKEIKRLDQTVFDFYQKLDDSEYREKQRLARESFDRYLRIDKFFALMFKDKKILDYTRKINYARR